MWTGWLSNVCVCVCVCVCEAWKANTSLCLLSVRGTQQLFLSARFAYNLYYKTFFALSKYNNILESKPSVHCSTVVNWVWTEVISASERNICLCYGQLPGSGLLCWERRQMKFSLILEKKSFTIDHYTRFFSFLFFFVKWHSLDY